MSAVVEIACAISCTECGQRMQMLFVGSRAGGRVYNEATPCGCVTNVRAVSNAVLRLELERLMRERP